MPRDPSKSDLAAAQSRTTDVYEVSASVWDQQRSKAFEEKAWLDRFCACLPAGGKILDAGCGGGIPIARYLLSQGLRVTGIDSSPAMIEIARARFPGGNWMVMDIRELSLPGSFDGIVGWDSFFHLPPVEQRSTLRLFRKYLNPGGALLITIGDRSGETLGMVNGHQVYHASLDPGEYQEILEAAGFANVIIELRDRDCTEHSVLLAHGYKP